MAARKLVNGRKKKKRQNPALTGIARRPKRHNPAFTGIKRRKPALTGIARRPNRHNPAFTGITRYSLGAKRGYPTLYDPRPPIIAPHPYFYGLYNPPTVHVHAPAAAPIAAPVAALAGRPASVSAYIEGDRFTGSLAKDIMRNRMFAAM